MRWPPSARHHHVAENPCASTPTRGQTSGYAWAARHDALQTGTDARGPVASELLVCQLAAGRRYGTSFESPFNFLYHSLIMASWRTRAGYVSALVLVTAAVSRVSARQEEAVVPVALQDDGFGPMDAAAAPAGVATLSLSVSPPAHPCIPRPKAGIAQQPCRCAACGAPRSGGVCLFVVGVERSKLGAARRSCRRDVPRDAQPSLRAPVAPALRSLACPPTARSYACALHPITDAPPPSRVQIAAKKQGAAPLPQEMADSRLARVLSFCCVRTCPQTGRAVLRRLADEKARGHRQPDEHHSPRYAWYAAPGC